MIFTNFAFYRFIIILFVERWFFLSWYKWPIAVSTDFGKYFVIFLFVSAGHVVRLLFYNALSSVDVFGIPNALCGYVITYSMLPYDIT